MDRFDCFFFFFCLFGINDDHLVIFYQESTFSVNEWGPNGWGAVFHIVIHYINSLEIYSSETNEQIQL